MASPEPSELPIIARLSEAEAIADLAREKITSAIEEVAGIERTPALAIGVVDCTEIFIGLSAGEQATGRILQRLCRALGDLIGDASDSVGDLLVGASDGINTVLGQVADLVDSAEASLVNAITDVVDAVATTLERSLRNIVAVVENVVSSVGNFLSFIVDRIDLGIRAVLSGLGFAISELIATVTRSFDALVSGVGRVIERIDATVRNIGEFIVTLAQATLESMSMSIAAVLGPLIGAGQSVVARLGDLVESVPGAVSDAAGALASGIGEFVGTPLNALGDIFVTQVEAFFGALIEEGQLSHGEIIRTLLTRLGAPADAIEGIAVAADEATPSTPGFTAAALSFLIPLIIAQFVGAALEPLATQTQQKISTATKQTLIAPADLLDGLFKGDIPESRFAEDFEQAGYTEERVTQLIATFRRTPDVSVQIQAWLRGMIEESELDTSLAANRIRPNDAALLKQVVFFVPPAQDLIRMAVREVFSPEIRERFGQDEDFPEEFSTFGAQIGLSDEWARSYWAAHWALPSPAQGFEMLHRKVIEPADLDTLLRALDVMPFWREKLTQIAFSPLTRVDLRRMHALGLLTDDELKTRYEAIGFAPDDAALMVAFTVAFNFSEDVLPAELEGLTRASILNMFEDGLIERADAVEFLTATGIGSDASELFVEQRELEVDRRNRRDLIESIVALAGGGRIGLPQAEDSLAQLGISAVEITRAIGRIVGKRDERDRLPTLAALTKMHKREIIDDEIFLETLKAHGFDDIWAPRTFELLATLPEAEVTGDV